MSDMQGRVAIVTGASRGIGFAIAQAIRDAGGSVCITGRKQDQLEAAVAALGERAVGVAGGADDEAHMRATVEKAQESFGVVDVLVNNAGINPAYGPLLEKSDGATIRKTLDVNVVAPIAWTKLVWENGMNECGGSVLNVASVGGIRGDVNLGMYNVSKAALIYLTKHLAIEMAPNVRVNAIAPAVVKTRFAEALYKGREKEVAASYPLGRLGETSDMASAALFLLGDESGWVTGQTLVLDGGILLTPPSE